MSAFVNILIKIIEKYQQKGGGEKLFFVDCNFTPTCSEFAKQAIFCFGVWHGGILAFKRINRCRQSEVTQKIPDPVPEKL